MSIMPHPPCREGHTPARLHERVQTLPLVHLLRRATYRCRRFTLIPYLGRYQAHRDDDDRGRGDGGEEQQGPEDRRACSDDADRPLKFHPVSGGRLHGEAKCPEAFSIETSTYAPNPRNSQCPARGSRTRAAQQTPARPERSVGAENFVGSNLTRVHAAGATSRRSTA
jgi:hypothetical protein